MTDERTEITHPLSTLSGLDVSDVSHAADMLTMHFGPLKHYRTRRGTLLEGGMWALHVQCSWSIERAGSVVANQADLRGTDEDANRTTERLSELLVSHVPAIVESVSADEAGRVIINLSRGLRLVVAPDGVEGDEDWRFFAPGSDERHFVIEGGRIDPDSVV